MEKISPVKPGHYSIEMTLRNQFDEEDMSTPEIGEVRVKEPLEVKHKNLDRDASKKRLMSPVY